MNETAKTVIEAIKPVADKIGEGAAHLYEVYTKQMVAEAIFAGIWVIISLFLLIFVTAVLSRKVTHQDKRVSRFVAWTNDTDGFAIVGFVVFYVLLGIVFSASLYDATLKSINPEYYAVERIIDQVKGE